MDSNLSPHKDDFLTKTVLNALNKSIEGDLDLKIFKFEFGDSNYIVCIKFFIDDTFLYSSEFVNDFKKEDIIKSLLENYNTVSNAFNYLSVDHYDTDFLSYQLNNKHIFNNDKFTFQTDFSELLQEQINLKKSPRDILQGL